VKQLSPFVLRLGGSLQDNISYEPKQPCEPVHDDPNGRWGFAGGCLKQDRWREIAAMCKELGCKLVFGLNGLAGRTHVQGTQWTGQWDSSNARQLLQFTKDEGIDVMAWELGNELGGWNGIQAQLTPEVRGLCVALCCAVLRCVHAWTPATCPVG
jgi:heparanase 1